MTTAAGQATSSEAPGSSATSPGTPPPAQASQARQDDSTPAPTVALPPARESAAPPAAESLELRAARAHAAVYVPMTPRDDIEPLTTDQRRIHFNVSRRFLQKLEAARAARSHARPGASNEALLEEALDLLLAREAKRRAGAADRPLARPRASSRDQIPAHVRREVWIRDGGRCQWPLAAGGVCGRTHRLELDHVVPRARGGGSTAAELRILCRFHNLEAARQVFGAAWMERFTAAATGQRRAPPHAAGGGGEAPAVRP